MDSVLVIRGDECQLKDIVLGLQHLGKVTSITLNNIDHVKQPLERAPDCEYCKKSFASWSNRQQHIDNKHRYVAASSNAMGLRESADQADPEAIEERIARAVAAALAQLKL